MITSAKIEQPDDQKPSTSHGVFNDDVDDDDGSDEPDELSDPTSSADEQSTNEFVLQTEFGFDYTIFCNFKGSSALAFISAFISGILVSITLRLYKLSRKYRYVMRILSKEKKLLKQERDFGQGSRIGSGRVWAPLPSVMRTQG